MERNASFIWTLGSNRIHRYGYRLRVVTENFEVLLGETWVQTPGLRLSLEGARPNPTARECRLVFELPDASSADLAVFDISGRLRFRREVGSLGAGRHLIQVPSSTWVSGLYLARLRCGSLELNAKVLLVR